MPLNKSGDFILNRIYNQNLLQENICDKFTRFKFNWSLIHWWQLKTFLLFQYFGVVLHKHNFTAASTGSYKNFFHLAVISGSGTVTTCQYSNSSDTDQGVFLIMWTFRYSLFKYPFVLLILNAFLWGSGILLLLLNPYMSLESWLQAL